jgi:hypothetical protein
MEIGEMIDTIRFRVPLNSVRERFFSQIASRYLQISPLGEVITEYMRFKNIPEDELTSQFRHIYINMFNGYLYFEFSLNKFISKCIKDIRLNHVNYTIATDILFLNKFIQLVNNYKVEMIDNDTGKVSYSSIDIKLREIEIMKIDLGINMKLNTNINYITNLFEYIHIHMGRLSKMTTEKYRGGLFYKSEYKAYKLYSKYEDVKQQLKKLVVKDVEDKQDKEKFKAILDDLKDIVRLEISYKKKYLKDKGIIYFKISDIYRLYEGFKEDMAKIINLTQFKKDKKIQKLNYKEKFLIKLCYNEGFANAKEIFIKEFSRPTFYRVKKSLLDKGINIKNITPEIYFKNNIDQIDDEFYIEFEVLPFNH